MMPVLNGWQFCEARCKEPRLAAIPLVVLSAAGGRPAAKVCDPVGQLVKPFELTPLLELIARSC